jgi:hypothetical protein
MEAGDPHQKLRAQTKACNAKDGQSYLMRTPEHKGILNPLQLNCNKTETLNMCRSRNDGGTTNRIRKVLYSTWKLTKSPNRKKVV